MHRHETQCRDFPNLCNVKQVLTSFFNDENIVHPAFVPVIDSEGNIDNTNFLWNKQITAAAAKFINNRHTLTHISQVPLVFYINLDTTIKRPTRPKSHSFIVIVINKNVFSFGLGKYLKDKREYITILSPDISEIFNIKYANNFIIKAISPLTLGFIGNLKKLLKTYPPMTNQVNIDFNMDESLKNIELRTNMPYAAFAILSGENCSSFTSKMSSTQCNVKSIRDNFYIGIHNPSSIRSNIYTPAQLNDFVTAILNKDDDFCIEWINRVYDIYHSTWNSKNLIEKTIDKVLPSIFSRNYSFSNKSKFLGFGKKSKTYKRKIKNKI